MAIETTISTVAPIMSIAQLPASKSTTLDDSYYHSSYPNATATDATMSTYTWSTDSSSLDGLSTTSLPGMPYTVTQSVLMTLCIAVIILLTIIGNTLIILSVILVRRLKSPPNYLYVSLAVCDMSVAICVMPLALVYQLYGEWPLGQTLCDVHLSFDMIGCTASIMHLCVISIDRYCAISRPFWYEKRRSPRLMFFYIGTAWTVAVLIPLPPLLFLGNERVKETSQCLVSQNLGYTVYSTAMAFYVPLIVMLTVYCKIFQTAEQIARQDLAATYFAPNPVTTENGYDANSKNAYPEKIAQKRRRTAKRNSITRERRAARTLGIIMGAFCLCWLPFFIGQVLGPFCKACVIPKHVLSFLLWLGYSNSLLNPVIYVTFNREFRKPYRYILMCGCRHLNQRINKDYAVKSSIRRSSPSRATTVAASHDVHLIPNAAKTIVRINGNPHKISKGKSESCV